MHPFRFVAPPPIVTVLADFLQRREEPHVQNVLTNAAIAAFDVGVLTRFPWLNEDQLNALLCTPRAEDLGNELRPIVTANPSRGAVNRHELREDGGGTRFFVRRT